MAKKKSSKYSLASQSFSYQAFLAFFLSSIIPLGLLVFVAHVYVFKGLLEEQQKIYLGTVSTAILLAAIVSILAFIVLRRTTKQTLDEIQGYNDRLKILLTVSNSLNSTAYSDILFRKTAESAGPLIDARVGYILIPNGDHVEETTVKEMWGDDAGELFSKERAPVIAMAEVVAKHRRPMLVADTSHEEGVHLFQEGYKKSELTSALCVPIFSQQEFFGALFLGQTDPNKHFTDGDLNATSTLAQQAGVALHNAHLQEEQKNFFTHVTEILVQSLDLYVDSQAGHSKRVAYYCNLIGREIKLSEEQLNRLYFAALLHDVGMLKIDRRHEPSLKMLQKHPVFGHKMILPIQVWKNIAPLILYHHEWHNGEGYPEGLKGEQIPVEAKIIGLAEAFDTMTHQDSYRKRMAVEEALKEIENCSGTQFDPAVVTAFLDIVNRGEIDT